MTLFGRASVPFEGFAVVLRVLERKAEGELRLRQTALGSKAKSFNCVGLARSFEPKAGEEGIGFGLQRIDEGGASPLSLM